MNKSGKACTGVANKIERKTIEKDRRIRMKGLCFKLVSLIPHHHFNVPKEFLSHQDQIEEAAAYIKILSERIEELKRRKREAEAALVMKRGGAIATNNGIKKININAAAAAANMELPILRIKDLGSNIEVVLVLVSGLHKRFMLHQIIRILEDGGAEVVSINLATVGDKIFHTLHAQVKISRVGVDTSRITGRIHELIF